MSFDTIVDGSGLAGLTVAALDAQGGARVLVLEAHTQPGGYGHSFGVGKPPDVYRFNAQLPYVWNCGPGQTAHNVLRTQRLADAVTFERLDPNGFDRMRIPGDARPLGRAAQVRSRPGAWRLLPSGPLGRPKECRGEGAPSDMLLDHSLMQRPARTSAPPMPTEAALTEDEVAPLIERLVAQCSLFQGIDRTELADLVQRFGHRLRLAQGEDLVTEGDQADALYFIECGRFEVRKLSEQGSRPPDGGHLIGQALPGDVVGEVALLDRGLRSATVRAAEDSVALMLRVRDLDQSVGTTPHPAVQMQLNLAREMAQKIRRTTSTAVRHLEEALDEERKRVELGRFMSRVLIGTCLYMFALVLMQPLKALVPDSTVFSVLILLGFAFGLYLNIRTSTFPLSAYGFTLARWKPAMVEAALFSLPFLAVIVLLKWVLLQTSPALAGWRLFDFYRPAGLGLGGTLAVVAAYALFVPIQEMVARSGVQSSLMLFLRPKHRVKMSIFMSTLLFSATHLHTSFQFAALVFPMGLFWGWLYSRNPTLVGVVLSHLLIGIWTVFVVSFPFF